MKAFISYSHQDEKALTRLHKHLVMLRRDELLTAWYDREILGGDNIDSGIASHLSDSQLFLALVSPDFLASDYCYDKEMVTALKRHEEGTIRVIPIILEPCDWRNSPLGNLKALPKDGQAISLWSNENVAYLDVVTGLRRIISSASKEVKVKNATAPSAQETALQPATRRYRVKKDFDRIDRDDFRRKAFGIIREYFQKSIAELDRIGDPIRARLENMGDGAFTCTILNKARRGGEAHITVHEHGMLQDISYSFSHRSKNNTANGFIRVDSDEYELHLKMDAFFGRSDSEKSLTPMEAAERLWGEFLGQAGISHD